MSKIQILFGFERTAVELQDGSFFEPLTDAMRRWEAGRRGSYRAAGYYFKVLYELRTGDYVLVEWSGCGQEQFKPGILSRTQTIWISEFPPRARRVSPVEALRFLVDNREAVPENLKGYLPELLKAKPSDKPPLPPRPIDYWANRELRGRISSEHAHQVDVLEVARQIEDFGISVVHLLRRQLAGERPHYRQLANLKDVLFSVYPVNTTCWWGAREQIPPERVGLLDLPWPPRTKRVHEIIAELQKLLRLPLRVMTSGGELAFWVLAMPLRATLPPLVSGKESDIPTPQECEAAEAALLETLPQLDALLVRLRLALEEIETKPSETTAGAPVPCPSQDAIRLYWLWMTTGATQADLAKLFQQAVKRPMTQGQVSRLLAGVKAWQEEGHALPVLEPPPPAKIQSIDPSVINQGPNRERRTPRQRHKRDDT